MFNVHGTALAAGGAIPKRFGIYWWGNGVRLSQWTPDSEGPDWRPKEELAPLAGVKDYVTVLTGLGCPIKAGTAHHAGRAQVLTGTDQRRSEYGASLLPSIDQVVAKQWDKLARFRSIELLVSRRGFENSGARGEVSQTGAGGFSPGESSPSLLFDRLFGGATALPVSPDDAKKVIAARQSVLDGVKADLGRLTARVGAADKQRLTQHLDGIRALEVQIQKTTVGGVCGKPARPGAFSQDRGHEDLEEVAHAMADLMALALACDITRVFTFEFSQMQSDTVFWQAGLNEGLHTVTHRSGPVAADQCHKTVVFGMKQLAYFAEKLKATREGAGNLLDSLCLYGTSEIAEGNSHSLSDMPMLVIGRGGGGLKSGQHYRSKTKESTNKVLLSMLKALGVPQTEVGLGPTLTSETLPALLA
jgi:hypothetical protein